MSHLPSTVDRLMTSGYLLQEMRHLYHIRDFIIEMQLTNCYTTSFSGGCGRVESSAMHVRFLLPLQPKPSPALGAEGLTDRL